MSTKAKTKSNQLLKNFPNVKTEVIVVTPEMAPQWLELMVKNRKPSQIIVDRYAKAMESGTWDLTGDSLKFDWNGQLIDGQHRLLACIQSKKPFVTIVIRGVDPESFKRIDQNRVRTSGQILGIEDFPHSNTMAASVTVIKEMNSSIETGSFPRGIGWGMRNRTSPDEVLDFARGHEALLFEGVTVVRAKDARRILKPPSAFAGLFFVLGQLNLSRTRQFFNYLITGEMLTANDPIQRLRQVLIDANLDTKVKRSAPWKSAITIKAWNSWLAGEEITSLRFRTKNEKFPKPRRKAAKAG